MKRRCRRSLPWSGLISFRRPIWKFYSIRPQYVTQVEDGSVEDQISSQIQNSLEAASDDRYQQALSSTKVNAELNGAKIRLPGFIVPLEFDEQQTVSQFFLGPLLWRLSAYASAAAKSDYFGELPGWHPTAGVVHAFLDTR